LDKKLTNAFNTFFEKNSTDNSPKASDKNEYGDSGENVSSNQPESKAESAPVSETTVPQVVTVDSGKLNGDGDNSVSSDSKDSDKKSQVNSDDDSVSSQFDEDDSSLKTEGIVSIIEENEENMDNSSQKKNS
jgi:hypothetical protein